ncbi:MAG: hypothetical protein AB7Q92_10730 [Acidimicrobiia bacterium]
MELEEPFPPWEVPQLVDSEIDELSTVERGRGPCVEQYLAAVRRSRDPGCAGGTRAGESATALVAGAARDRHARAGMDAIRPARLTQRALRRHSCRHRRLGGCEPRHHGAEGRGNSAPGVRFGYHPHELAESGQDGGSVRRPRFPQFGGTVVLGEQERSLLHRASRHVRIMPPTGPRCCRAEVVEGATQERDTPS